MTRGDVHIYLGPPTPTERDRKPRPVVIVSLNAVNQRPANPYVTVVPITSNVERIYPLEIDLREYLDKLSKAQPQYVFTCRKLDLSSEPVVGLPQWLVEEIDESLRLYLAL